MASGYARVVAINGVSGEPLCVELPTPPRGTLERLIVTQTSGAGGASTISVYNRKGACSVAVDLNVDESGEVTDVTESSGQAAVQTSAAHNLKVGDTIEIKGCDVAAYNVTHTVTAVTSDTIVVTDISYTSDGTGGLWQTSPFMPTNNPNSHLIYTGALVSGSLQAFDIGRGFENRDNQSETKRCRHAGLWAEFTPDVTASYEIAITCEADSVI
jgi:hypothetical protein